MMQRKIWANSRTIGKLKQSALQSTTSMSGKRGVSHALAIGLAALWLTDSQPALANPQNGVVVDGAATINHSGNTTTINQSSQNVSINWESFSIGAGETTQFIQPNASSLAINRVTGSDPSSIFGNLIANGRVILINPNGVFFEQGSKVDVSGLLATTSDFEQSDFDPDVLNFTMPTDVEGAEIINEGDITVKEGGFAALVAPRVRNNGTIVARLGKVTLASGNTFTLDLRGDQLIQLELPTDPSLVPDDTRALVENAGRISAEGGMVALKAKSIGDLLKTVVNTSGIIEANSFANNQGKITLSAVGDGGVEIAGSVEARGRLAAEKGGLVEITANNLKMVGDIDASSQLAQGGTVKVNGSGFVSLGGDINVDGQDGGTVSITARDLSAAETISARGTGGEGGEINIDVAETSLEIGNARYDASGVNKGGTIRHVAQHQITSSATYDATASEGTGGNVDISANTVKLLSTKVDVSGKTSGGRIRVGGEFQGGKDGNEELLNAEKLAGTTGTELKADATGPDGDGGRVIVWSDENTTFLGDISAVPGDISGTGGFVELSSAGNLTFNGVQQVQNDGTTVTSSAHIDVGTGDRAGTVLFDPKNIIIVDEAFSQYNLILGFNYTKTSDFGEIISVGDSFGSAVSLDGTMLAVAASGDDGDLGSGSDRSAIYLISFTDNDFNGGALEGLIGAGYTGGKNIDTNSFETNNSFGAAISLDQNRLVASATLSPDGGANSGAVHMFTFADDKFTAGVHVGKMAIGATGPGDVNTSGITAVGGNFGTGLGLDGQNLAIGERNSDVVHMFRFADLLFNGGSHIGSIGLTGAGGQGLTINGTSVGSDSLTVEAGDRFGQTVALQGTQLVVGATFDDGVANGGVNSGAVYLINFDSATTLANPTVNAIIGRSYSGGNNINSAGFSSSLPTEFGSAVTIDNNMLAVGSIESNGRVHLFNMSDANYNGLTEAGHIGTGLNGAKDINTNGLTQGGDSFGNSGLSLDNFRLAIGAASDAGESNNVAGTGAVHIFKFDDALFNNGRRIATFGHGYAEIAEIRVANLDAGDNFGTSVDIDGNRMVVGATADKGLTNAGTNRGAVYLFDFADADFNGGKLVGIMGDGYTGGKNVDLGSLLFDEDKFGSSVGLEGTQLVVGATGDDGAGVNNSNDFGAVHLFTFTDTAFNGASHVGSIGNGYTGLASEDISAETGTGDRIGEAVSIDGNRIAIGARQDDGASDVEADSGAVYLFTFDNTTFDNPVLQARIGRYTGGKNVQVASLENSDFFGDSVSLSGNSLAVGVSQDDGNGNTAAEAGAVMLFTFSDATFSGGTHVATIGEGYTGGNNIDITASLEPNDRFGSGIALDGTNLAVGAIRDDGASNSATDSGAVLLFNFSDAVFNGGVHKGTIGNGYNGASDFNFEDAATSDQFGSSLALDGQRLVVGAINDDGLNNDLANPGAVHYFKFFTSNLSGAQFKGSAGFGYVGLDGNADLSADGTPDASDFFGSSVALDGNRLAVGAIGDDGSGDFGTDFGAVYLFSFADPEFNGAKLEGIIGAGYNGDKNVDIGSNLNNADFFGTSVSLDGQRLVVGASRDDGASNSVTDSGAVYMFSFSDTVFSGGALEGIIGDGYTGGKNVNVNLDANDDFGRDVSLSGNILAVGAPADDGASNSQTDAGAVHLFSFSHSPGNFDGAVAEATVGMDYTGGKNFNTTTLTGIDPGDFFGHGVAIEGNKLAIGAPLDDGSGAVALNSGTIFTFTFDNVSAPVFRNTVGVGYTGGNDINLAGIVDAGDQFGFDVDMSGLHMVIGANKDGGASNTITESGSIHIFKYDDNNFTNIASAGRIGHGFVGNNEVDLTARLGANDGLGSVSIDGVNIAGGASADDGIGDVKTDAGVVYFFTLDGPNPITEGLFASNPGGTTTLSVKAIEDLLKAGTSVILQASNDITLQTILNASGGVAGADLNLIAGRTIDLSTGDITLNNGNLLLLANAGLPAGVIDVDRESGAANVTMSLTTDIVTGTGDIIVHLADGAGQTQSATGNISFGHLSGNIISMRHSGTTGSIVEAGAGPVLTATGGVDLSFDNAANTAGNIQAAFSAPLIEAKTFGGNINLTANSNFSIGGQSGAINGLEVGGGTLSIFSSGGVDITQTETITGATIFDLNNTTGNTTLTQAGNNWGTIRTTLTTPGSRNNNVILNEVDGFAFGNVSFGTDGNLDVTSGNTIDATATALEIAGTMTANTATGNINFVNASNQFAGAINLTTTGNASIGANTNVVIAGASVSGVLNVIAGSNTISSSGNITTTNAVLNANQINLTTGAIALGFLDVTAPNATINELDGVTLTNANVTGVFTLTSGGNILQSGSVSIASLDANANGDIILNNGSNNIATFGASGGTNIDVFTTEAGTFNISGLNVTGNANFNATSAANIAQAAAMNVGGNFSFTSGGNMLLDNASNNVGGSVVFATPGNVDWNESSGQQFGAVNVGGVLSVEGVNGITQTAAMTAGTLSVINLTGDIFLGDAGNNFTNVNVQSGTNITIHNGSGGSVTYQGLVATGNVQLASNRDLTQSGIFNITGNLDIDMATGASFSFTNAGNNVGGTVTFSDGGGSAYNTAWTEAGTVNLGQIDWGGASSATIQSVNNDIISTTTNQTIGGTATYNAGNGAVRLIAAGNNFSGNLAITASTTIDVDSNANALNLAATSTDGNITVLANGLTVSGAVTSANGNILLHSNHGQNMVLGSAIAATTGQVSIIGSHFDLNSTINAPAGVAISYLGDNVAASDFSIKLDQNALTDATNTIMEIDGSEISNITTNNFVIQRDAGDHSVVAFVSNNVNLSSFANAVIDVNGIQLNQAANSSLAAANLTLNAIAPPSAVANTLEDGLILSDASGPGNFGGINASGSLTINAKRFDIDGPMTITGGTTLTATGNNRSALTNTANSFGGNVTILGGFDMGIASAGNMILGGVTLTDDLQVIMNNGQLSQTGTVSVDTLQLQTGSTSGASDNFDVNLTNAGNQINAVALFAAPTTGGAGNLRNIDVTSSTTLGLATLNEFNDATDTPTAVTLTGDLTLNTTNQSGDLATLPVNLTANNISITAPNGINFNGNLTATSSLSMTASSGSIKANTLTAPSMTLSAGNEMQVASANASSSFNFNATGFGFSDSGSVFNGPINAFTPPPGEETQPEDIVDDIPDTPEVTDPGSDIFVPEETAPPPPDETPPTTGEEPVASGGDGDSGSEDSNANDNPEGEENAGSDETASDEESDEEDTASEEEGGEEGGEEVAGDPAPEQPPQSAEEQQAAENLAGDALETNGDVVLDPEAADLSADATLLAESDVKSDGELQDNADATGDQELAEATTDILDLLGDAADGGATGDGGAPVDVAQAPAGAYGETTTLVPGLLTFEPEPVAPPAGGTPAPGAGSGPAGGAPEPVNPVAVAAISDSGPGSAAPTGGAPEAGAGTEAPAATGAGAAGSGNQQPGGAGQAPALDGLGENGSLPPNFGYMGSF